MEEYKECLLSFHFCLQQKQKCKHNAAQQSRQREEISTLRQKLFLTFLNYFTDYYKKKKTK